MVIGLRILACMIDIIFAISTIIIPTILLGWSIEKLGALGIILIPFNAILFFTWPLLCIAIPTGIWGKSLGKFLCRLKVKDAYGRPPGIWRALGREVFKVFSVYSVVGAIVAWLQIIYQGETWYDHLCHTEVEFNEYIRLTKTQKNWRKQMKK